MKKIQCQCEGFGWLREYREPEDVVCIRDVTQEDGLCDWCRAIKCHTVTDQVDLMHRVRLYKQNAYIS